jgi:hypothetical protein
MAARNEAYCDSASFAGAAVEVAAAVAAAAANASE